MGQTATQQRESWKQFDCNPDAMAVIDLGPDRVRVAPPAVDALQGWLALNARSGKMACAGLPVLD
jgi:hypothetical protein